jgi:CRP-like cAMP-binding protein
MNLASARDVMRQSSWLSARPAAFCDELLGRSSLRTLKKGEFVYHLDDSPGMLFGVVTGAVIILVPNGSNGLQAGHLMREGHWFGEASAIHLVNRQVAIEAATDANLLTVPVSAVQGLIRDFPNAMNHFSALVLDSLLVAMRSGADLLLRDLRKRICSRLLTLSGLRLGENARPEPCDLPITQDQFAAMCGLSRNSVNRGLAELEKDGLCRSAYGRIHIPDLKAIEAQLGK